VVRVVELHVIVNIFNSNNIGSPIVKLNFLMKC